MGVGDQDLIDSGDAPRGDAPQVAVIIPVRNRADLLSKTLAALRTQTLADHEVIVVDDGSTDGSDEVVAKAAADDDRVRLIRATGSGAVAARSQAVAEARSPILAFTDSDCVPGPRWLEVGVAAVDGGADVVQGRTQPARDVRPLERSVWSMVEDGLYATCNVFYRRSSFEAAGGFDGHAGDRLGFRPGSKLRGYGFGEDTLIGWRVRRAGVGAFAPDAVVAHAVFPPDLSDTFTRAWTMGAFPGLIREVPELRALMAEDLRRGLRRRAPLYGLAAGVLLRQRSIVVAALCLWVCGQWRELRLTEPSRARLIRVLPVHLGLDVTHAVALLWGSARSRTPIF